MDVVSLICGKAAQQDGISCFKYVRGAALQHASFGIYWWCLYTVIYMGWVVFLFKVRVGVCKLLQAGGSVSTPYGCFCHLISKHKQMLHIQLCNVLSCQMNCNHIFSCRSNLGVLCVVLKPPLAVLWRIVFSLSFLWSLCALQYISGREGISSNLAPHGHSHALKDELISFCWTKVKVDVTSQNTNILL